jgi:hypothetical protein
VVHELGHVLGFEHDDEAGDAMSAMLDVGRRFVLAPVEPTVAAAPATAWSGQGQGIQLFHEGFGAFIGADEFDLLDSLDPRRAAQRNAASPAALPPAVAGIDWSTSWGRERRGTTGA